MGAEALGCVNVAMWLKVSSTQTLLILYDSIEK